MAAHDRTTSPAYQAPAWLRYYAEGADSRSLLSAVEAYSDSMDALLDVLSDEDSPDNGRVLALDGYHKTQDLREFLAHWRTSQAPTTATADDPADNTAEVDRLVSAVHDLVLERLTADEARWISVAFRAAYDGDLQKASRVIENTRKNFRRAKVEEVES